MNTVTTKQNILIIDDEEDILTTCQSILEDEGYEVDIAKNYQEAENILNDKKVNFGIFRCMASGCRRT